MNWMNTILLMAVMTFLLMTLGAFLGGKDGALVAFGIAGVMNLVAYWFSDKMVLAAYRAKKVGPEDATGLYDIVRELASQAQLPMPKVYIIPEQTLNAFATGRNPEHSVVADVGHDQIEPPSAPPETHHPRVRVVWERFPERRQVPLGLLSGRRGSICRVGGQFGPAGRPWKLVPGTPRAPDHTIRGPLSCVMEGLGRRVQAETAPRPTGAAGSAAVVAEPG